MTTTPDQQKAEDDAMKRRLKKPDPALPKPTDDELTYRAPTPTT